MTARQKEAKLERRRAHGIQQAQRRRQTLRACEAEAKASKKGEKDVHQRMRRHGYVLWEIKRVIKRVGHPPETVKVMKWMRS